MELDEADEMVRNGKYTWTYSRPPPRNLQISQMEIEILAIPQSIKPQYQTRIRSSKADLAHYKKLSREMHAQASRADLFSRAGGAPATSDEPYGSSDRARLLAGTTILEDGSRRLQESQRIALETEEQGADILRSLVGQREQIENARNTVRC
jgi:vesicle transport through interaction with t-SNAREs 1